MSESNLDESDFSLTSEETKLNPVVDKSARKCTDIFCILIFLGYWIGFIIFSGIAFSHGKPARLLYGTDYAGNTCGDGDKEEYRYITFPRVFQDVSVGTQFLTGLGLDGNILFGVCQKRCPREGEYVCTDEAEASVGKALEANPLTDRKSVIDACQVNSIEEFLLGKPPGCYDEKIQKECYENLFNTTALLFTCFPEYEYIVEVLENETSCTKYKYTIQIGGQVQPKCVRFREVAKVTREEPTNSNVLFDQYNTVARHLDNLVSDLIKTYPLILGVGIGVTAVIAMIYIISLWCWAGCVVWLSIFLTFMVLGLFSVVCYYYGGILNDGHLLVFSDKTTEFLNRAAARFNPTLDEPRFDVNTTHGKLQKGFALPARFSELSSNHEKGFEIVAYILTAVTILYLLIVIFLFSRIRRAISMFHQASAAIQSNPLVLFAPMLNMIFITATIGFWGTATIYLASVEDYSTQEYDINQALNTSSNTQIAGDFSFDVSKVAESKYKWPMQIYLFFGLLWTLSFFSGISILTISGTVGSWYWARADKSNMKKASGLCGSLYIALRFHTGTAAFGALLIAISQLIQYLFAYVSYRLRHLQKKNKLLKILICCIGCVLNCIKLCMKYVSRNALLMTALYGTSFCKSTSMAFLAITSNIAQVAAVSLLGDIILRLGQLLVTSLAGFIILILINNNPKYDFDGDDELSSKVFPVLLTILLAWYVSNEVLSVYDVTVDTIMLSYCQDKKLLKKLKSSHQMQSHASLDSFVQKHRSIIPNQQSEKTSMFSENSSNLNREQPYGSATETRSTIL